MHETTEVTISFGQGVQLGMSIVVGAFLLSVIIVPTLMILATLVGSELSK